MVGNANSFKAPQNTISAKRIKLVDTISKKKNNNNKKKILEILRSHEIMDGDQEIPSFHKGLADHIDDVYQAFLEEDLASSLLEGLLCYIVIIHYIVCPFVFSIVSSSFFLLFLLFFTIGGTSGFSKLNFFLG